MKITVTGTGYVGLVTAVCLAEKGYDLTCIDVNENKIEMLKNGQCPIHEKDLQEMLTKYADKLTKINNCILQNSDNNFK